MLAGGSRCDDGFDYRINLVIADYGLDLDPGQLLLGRPGLTSQVGLGDSGLLDLSHRRSTCWVSRWSVDVHWAWVAYFRLP